MIFPRKKLILPCHKNGYLQSASDARKYRDRFKHNPLAKVADMFIPRPLRMSPGYPCCCGGKHWSCSCLGSTMPDTYRVEIANSGYAELDQIWYIELDGCYGIIPTDASCSCSFGNGCSYLKLEYNDVGIVVTAYGGSPVSYNLFIWRDLHPEGSWQPCKYTGYVPLFARNVYLCPAASASATCYVSPVEE